MTAPTNPPLILTTDVATNYNFNAANTESSIRMLNAIVEASGWLEEMARRYFVPRSETRYFKAYSYANGGDIDGSELWLDRDLQSTQPTITNGDNAAVASTAYILAPRNGVSKYIIRLLPTSGIVWTSAANDPESITVNATWCYGGQWKSTGLTGTVATTDGTILTANGATIVTGAILKVDSEFMYVETGGVAGLTVTRAYLGSTGATHNAATIYRWESARAVQSVIKRMVGIAKERDKSPIMGAASVGDFSTPYRVDKLPEDVRLDVSRLAFSTRIGGF